MVATNNNAEDLRKDPTVASVSVADTKSVSQGAIINMYHSRAIGEAVLKNKKFRAVLEYDPESKKAIFYIRFDEPGGQPGGETLI